MRRHLRAALADSGRPVAGELESARKSRPSLLNMMDARQVDMAVCDTEFQVAGGQHSRLVIVMRRRIERGWPGTDFDLRHIDARREVGHAGVDTVDRLIVEHRMLHGGVGASL